MARPARIVTIEKRKWSGPASARWAARLVAEADGLQVLIAPAGTSRSRPARGRVERLDQDELTIAGPEWWVATARLGRDLSPVAWKVDAATPARWACDDLLAFTDLDLDLLVDAADPDGRVVDRDVLATRAVRDGYPPAIVEGAEAGIEAAIRRLAGGEAPFNGWVDRLLARPLVPTV